MIFTRYIGEEGRIEPCLTPGKVYMADNGGASDALDDTVVSLVNDCGERVAIPTGDGKFEFLAEVYAVVVRAVANYERGQVVIVADADDDGYFQVDGRFFKSDSFEVLDRTNLRPGIMVEMLASHEWVKVTSVSETMQMRVGDRDCLPSDFRFAVGNGGVLMEPMVKCVSSEGLDGELTVGCLYRVLSANENDTLKIINNNGKPDIYMASRFTWDY